MKYTIHSYSKESIPFLGHIKFSQDTDTEEQARKIAKEQHRKGDLRVHVTKGKEVIFHYAEVSK